MALTPSERERLSDRLTRILHNLVDRPDNVPLAQTLRANGIHVTDLSVHVGEPKREAPLDEMFEQWQRENEIMQRRIELLGQAHYHTPWEDFVFVCSKKVDVTGLWRPTIAQAISVNLSAMQWRQTVGTVPTEWLEKLNELPDWKPTPRPRSNFAQIAGELARRLRPSGMSRQEIATAFNEFLRDFNGTHVSAADIASSLG
jgi:hypothetical protein